VLVPVPTLDQVMAKPEILNGLPPEVVRALLLQLSGLLVALASATTTGPATTPKVEPADEWITPEEVGGRFGLDAQWLRRHRRLLRARKALTTPSRKKSLYHVARLRRLLEERTALSP
jgi:hypothetical protein